MTTIRKATKGFSAFPRDDGETHPRNYFKKRKVFFFLARIILHFLNELEEVLKASVWDGGGKRVHGRFSSAFHNKFKLRQGLKYDLNSLEKCKALGTFLLDLDRFARQTDWVQKARVAWAGEKLLMNKFPFRIFYCVLFHLSFPIPARVRKKCDKSVFSRKTSQANGDKFDFIQVSFYAIAWAARGRFYWIFTYTFSIQELFYWSAQMLLNKFSFYWKCDRNLFRHPSPPFLGRVVCSSPRSCRFSTQLTVTSNTELFLHYSPCQGFLSLVHLKSTKNAETFLPFSVQNKHKKWINFTFQLEIEATQVRQGISARAEIFSAPRQKW